MSTRDQVLRIETQRIETSVQDLLSELGQGMLGGTPLVPLSCEEYFKKRVVHQINWYLDNASKLQAKARLLRTVEFMLALAATILTAVAGAYDKKDLVGAAPWGIDWLALAAVLTTVSGTILAHIEASRFDSLIVSYRAAAHRLRNELEAAPDNMQAPSAAWSLFTNACEQILAEENGSWMAGFNQPVARAGTQVDADGGTGPRTDEPARP